MQISRNYLNQTCWGGFYFQKQPSRSVLQNCHAKHCSALSLFCSCDQNARKILTNEFILSKVETFNFNYFTSCNLNTSYFRDIFLIFWSKVLNIKFKEHSLVVVSFIDEEILRRPLLRGVPKSRLFGTYKNNFKNTCVLFLWKLYDRNPELC